MNYFQYSKGRLYCEEVDLSRIAQEVGTPVYIYSERTLLRHYNRLDQAFGTLPHLVCYGVKANCNLAVLRCLAEAGSGAEVVSGGELFRALRAGFPPEKIAFNGNGKSAAELRQGVEARILCFNVDGEGELRQLDQVARDCGARAPIAVRVNPNIDPKTHPYISTGLRESKFGVQFDQALELYRITKELDHLDIVGVHSHIGSQITQLEPFVEAVARLVELVQQLQSEGIQIDHINLGGGIGITYKDESPPSYEEYVAAIRPLVEPMGCKILVEPGRTLVGNVGILLTRVLYMKMGDPKNFVVVDAGMNDLLRPPMYNSYHEIRPCQETTRQNGTITADVVGPICESGDFIAREREIPQVEPGDLLAVMSAGAYGAVMASNYNARPLVPEVFVSGDSYKVVRRRQTYEDMVALEED